MRILSIFLALINSLLAGLLITFLVTSADFKHSMVWWSVFRILIALSIIMIGILSWIAMIVPFGPGLMVLGSLFLVAIGPSRIVWTFQRASMKGDMEYYMGLLYGASLFVQGVSLLLGIAEGQDQTFAA